MEKICSKCGKAKPVSEFNKKRKSYNYICKMCQSIYIKEYCRRHREKRRLQQRIRYEINRDRILKDNKEYRDTHKEQIAEYKKQIDKDILRKCRKKHREKYKESIRIKRAEQARQQRKNNYWRYTTDYKLWKESIYKRDNYTCQLCGKTHCKVNAHHIQFGGEHPELRYEVDNGICLCMACHKKIHNTFKMSNQINLFA